MYPEYILCAKFSDSSHPTVFEGVMGESRWNNLRTRLRLCRKFVLDPISISSTPHDIRPKVDFMVECQERYRP